MKNHEKKIRKKILPISIFVQFLLFLSHTHRSSFKKHVLNKTVLVTENNIFDTNIYFFSTFVKIVSF